MRGVPQMLYTPMSNKGFQVDFALGYEGDGKWVIASLISLVSFSKDAHGHSTYSISEGTLVVQLLYDELANVNRNVRMSHPNLSWMSF